MASISSSLSRRMMEDASSKNHLHLVLVTVVGQRDQPFSREPRSLTCDLGHSAADAFRVLDGDPVESAAVAVGDLEAFPGPGNAGIDAETGNLASGNRES